jgi:hypothetical protein
MDIEKIIEKITKNVIERIIAYQSGEEGAKNAEESFEKFLVILPRFTVNIEKYLNYIKQKFSDIRPVIATYGEYRNSLGKYDADITLLCFDDEQDRQSILDKFESFSFICCVSPGIKLMENLASVNDEGIIENLILKAVLYNKHVRILIDYDLNSAPMNSLTRKIKGFFETFIGMGISIEFLTINGGSQNILPVRENQLITEEDIDVFWESGNREINCGKGCIITPLAQDRAREIGLKILFDGR